MTDRRLSRHPGTRVDARCDLAVARLAAEQWGVLSMGELYRCGLTDSAIRRRVERGRLHRLHTGVYAIGHPAPSWEGRLLAAVKACGRRAVLSHLSAAALWGFIELDERHPEVTVVGEGTRLRPGIRVHRTAGLDPKDVSRRHGIPVTSVPRTILDLAAELGEKPLRNAVRSAQGHRLVNIPRLAEAIDRLGPRRGSARLRRLIATGPAPTHTELENLVLDLLRRGGVEHPEINRPLRLAGRRVVPDFRWPGQRLVLEADGAAWHEEKIAREDDAERQAVLEAHGERVVRVTWKQALRQPEQTLARLRAAGAPPARESRPAGLIGG